MTNNASKSEPNQWRPWSRSIHEARRQAGRRAVYQPAVVVAVAVAAGIAFDRYAATAWGLDGSGWLVAPALVAWGVAWKRMQNRTAVTLLLLTVALTAGDWHHQHWRVFSADDLGRYTAAESSPICFEAVVLTSPARRSPAPRSAYRAIPQVESTRLTVRPTRLRDGKRWRPAAGRCELLVDGHLVGVRPGDRLRVFGQLSRFPHATNPGQFDSALHNRADRELCRVRIGSPACVTVTATGSAIEPQRWIDRVRATASAAIDRSLPRRQADLMAAMLLGDRDRTPPDVAERFRRTGAMHVLVVSGLHVGLVLAVGAFAMRMGWLRRKRAIVGLMLLAIGYGLLAGGRPPVVRAVVLAEVMGVAALLGRRVVAFNSLAAAAAVVLMVNPTELFRTGTQLSFLATATLIWFGTRKLENQNNDPLDRLIASLRPWWQQGLISLGRWGWLLGSATLAVWIVSAPLLLFRFHLLSPAAVPMSLIVFPLVAVAVTSGLGLMVVGSVAPFAAAPFALIAGQATRLLDTSLDLVDDLPGATLWAPGPAWWWVLGAYGLMAAALAVRHFPTALPILFRAGIAWIPTAFLPLAMNAAAEDRFEATFIDVGHGVSVLIETPDGGTLLYDAGSLGSPEQAAETIAGVLWSRGQTRIDAVVLSHADVDHFNALPGLLDRFRIGGVYVSPMMLPPLPIDDDSRSAPAMLRRLLTKRGVPVQTLQTGDRLHVGTLTADVLHPTRLGVLGSDNANSLVLGVEIAGRRLLLPGDLEGDGLLTLIEDEPYDYDVLLAPHHGSSRSDPPGFAAWSRPELVVISGGTRSRDAGASYVEAGARVLRTNEVGAVRTIFRAGGPISAQPLISP